MRLTPTRPCAKPLLLAAIHLATIFLAGGPAAAQDEASASLPTVRGPVRLDAPLPPAPGGIEHVGRVRPGPGVTPAVAARIDAALDRDRRQTDADAADCRRTGGEWQRHVDVTMRGPGYLALLATDGYECGAPYPTDAEETPTVYDLATGRPVDWPRVFPPGARLAPVSGWVLWPELTRRAEAAARQECREAFETGHEFTKGEVPFRVGLDARAGALRATPADFAHIDTPCVEALSIPVADLRRLGFASALVEALDQAHRLQP